MAFDHALSMLRKPLLLIIWCWPMAALAGEGHVHIRTLASSCAICHGGASPAIPNLNGIKAGRFIQQMKAYQTSSHAHEVMVQHAKGLTESEIQQLAAFFSLQPPLEPAHQQPPADQRQEK